MPTLNVDDSFIFRHGRLDAGPRNTAASGCSEIVRPLQKLRNTLSQNYIQPWVRTQEQKPLPISSSQPPKFPPEQEQLFREVLQVMNESKIPYVVSGAFALGQHTGIWRNTKDLDLFLSPEDVPPSLKKLEEMGFETEVCDPVWLAKARRGEFYVDLITGMSNAVIMVDRSWIERGLAAEVMGVPSRVLAPEELIASKLFVTRRERFDGADIIHVIHSTQGKLDWDRVLEIVGEHWMIVLWALVLFQYTYPADWNYIPRQVWDNLLGRLQQELNSPNPRAHFRGSLIDENMFAIDVKEWGLANLIEYHRGLRDGRTLPPPGSADPAA